MLAIAVSLNVLNANAVQTTVDFETPLLAPDSYDQGVDGQGGFLCQGTLFSNFYADYGYYQLWENWALSNKTDTITPDYGNQFSAIPGSGQLGSSQYAIGFGSFGNNNTTTLDFVEPRSLAGGYFTNTTYDYFAMADGNGFATKFARAHNDYFKMTITGVDPLGNTTGSAAIYLADFRDPAIRTDNPRTDDYILDTWDWVNLAGLGGNVKSLNFSFASSDVGDYGINTPLYFALDNLTFEGAIANHPVWCGAGADNLLSNADNWNGPLIQSGEPLQFAGILQSNAVNDLNDASFAGIDWHYGAGPMTLSGNAIKLTGDVDNYGANPQTLDLPIALAGSRMFDAVLGDIEVQGVLGDAETPGGIVKRGGGKLILSAPNGYTGDTDVEEGSLVLAGDGSIAAASLVTIASGAILEIAPGNHVVGTIDGGGTTIVDPGATLTAASITQDSLIIGTSQAVAVPEPGTLWLLLVAASGVICARAGFGRG